MPPGVHQYIGQLVVAGFGMILMLVVSYYIGHLFRKRLTKNNPNTIEKCIDGLGEKLEAAMKDHELQVQRRHDAVIKQFADLGRQLADIEKTIIKMNSRNL